MRTTGPLLYDPGARLRRGANPLVQYISTIIESVGVVTVSRLSSRRETDVALSCVWMDAIIRVVGALSLWGVEIVMQLRIYALFRLSKRVAVINAVLFLGSVAGFMGILVHNGLVRASVIAQAKSLPIPGCPVVHTGIEWAQWVPGAPTFTIILVKMLN